MIGYPLYNLLLHPVMLGYAAVSLVSGNPKRKGSIRPKMGLDLPKAWPGGLWIHALSVGEVNSARPLLEEIRRRRPKLKINLTASTTTGLATAQKEVKAGRADAAVFCPLDLPRSVNRFVDAIKPCGLVIVETDIWPNILRTCHRRTIPSVLINFRISQSRHRSHLMLKSFFETVYGHLAAITTPSPIDRDRLDALSLPVTVTALTGSLKFDCQTLKPDRPQDLGLTPDQPVVIAGSTHEGEETIILRAWSELRRTYPDLALILAPRDEPRFDRVAELIHIHGYKPNRLSNNENVQADRPILLADSMGRLGSLYGTAKAAFVGGSLVDQGGHNPLEPASLGIPVAFGPHMEDFLTESEALIKCGGAVQVKNTAELVQTWQSWLDDSEETKQAGLAGKRFIDTNRGAAERAADILGRVMSW